MRDIQKPYVLSDGKSIKWLKAKESVFSATNASCHTLPSGHVMSVEVSGNVVTSAEYAEKHPQLQGSVVDAIFLEDLGSEGWLMLDVLEFHSFVAQFQQRSLRRECNVELRINKDTLTVSLHVIKEIPSGAVFILYNRCCNNPFDQRYHTAYNADRVREISARRRELAMFENENDGEQRLVEVSSFVSRPDSEGCIVTYEVHAKETKKRRTQLPETHVISQDTTSQVLDVRFSDMLFTEEGDNMESWLTNPKCVSGTADVGL